MPVSRFRPFAPSRFSFSIAKARKSEDAKGRRGVLVSIYETAMKTSLRHCGMLYTNHVSV
jgi:hypothetical protein